MGLKKLLFIPMALTILCGISLGQTLTMVSPNDGGSFNIGDSMEIIWNAEDTANPFKITLWQNDSLVGLIADNVTAGNGRRTYNWDRIGTLAGRTASAGTGYKIKIKEKRTSATCRSRVPFTLVFGTGPIDPSSTFRYSIPVHNPPVKVIFPNGGERLKRGVEYQLKWEAVDNFGRPRLIIKKGSHIEMNIPPERVFATKTRAGWHWSWIISNKFSGGNNYKFRIENANGRLWDESDASFTIEASDREITYVAPTDRTLFLTQQKLIRWRSNGISSFRIDLISPSSSQILARSISTNRYTWVVGQLEHENAHVDPKAEYHKIVISAMDEGPGSSSSQEIDIQEPDMSVSIDPFSSNINMGDRKTINWRTSNLRGKVNIDVYWERFPGYFAKVTTLVYNARSNGSYSWHIFPEPGPMEGSLDTPPPKNKKYKIRLVSTLVPYLYAESREFTLK
jgi:hypothetical protein